jgi:hypothetical protein
MLWAIMTLFLEGACGRSMVRLHHPAADYAAHQAATGAL